MLKNYLLSPLCSASALHLSLFQPSFSFSFNASFFFSSLLVYASLILFCFPAPFFFLVLALPFLLQRPSLFSSSPFSFLQVCCPLIFSPKYFLQPKCFSAQKHFFSVQLLFSSSFFCFILFWFSPIFSLFNFGAPFFFFSLAPFIQDPIFSLAASHLFYLNKSLLSSNLE